MKSLSRSLRLLLVLLALSTAGWAQTAAAAIRVSFYSHGWGIGPRGETLFPHTFIRVEGNPYGGVAVDQTYGFFAYSVSRAMGNHPGYIAATGKGYAGESTLNFWLEISDDQYKALMDRIVWWETPEGSIYNLKTRTCIHFVADMASTLGLKPGNARTWKPQVFMDETLRLNADRLTVPPPPAPVPASVAPPAVSAPPEPAAASGP